MGNGAEFEYILKDVSFLPLGHDACAMEDMAMVADFQGMIEYAKSRYQIISIISGAR